MGGAHARPRQRGLQAAQVDDRSRIRPRRQALRGCRAPCSSFFAREGRHIAALRLSLRAEQGLGNWREVARLVRQLEKHQALTAEQAAPIRSRALREALRGSARRSLGPDALLARTRRGDRAEPALALETARRLMAAGDCREAQRVIEDALDERWDASLVLAYGDCGKPRPRAMCSGASRRPRNGCSACRATASCCLRWDGCAVSSSSGARRAATWKRRWPSRRRARRMSNWRSYWSSSKSRRWRHATIAARPCSQPRRAKPWRPGPSTSV
jgi:hypothetical protein